MSQYLGTALDFLWIPQPSLAEQDISDLGAAWLDAAHYDHEMPSASMPGSYFLALYFGSRVNRSKDVADQFSA
jgi:hypothetical protein